MHVYRYIYLLISVQPHSSSKQSMLVYLNVYIFNPCISDLHARTRAFLELTIFEVANVFAEAKDPSWCQ